MWSFGKTKPFDCHLIHVEEWGALRLTDLLYQAESPLGDTTAAGELMELSLAQASR
jgi:hypothetical protein